MSPRSPASGPGRKAVAVIVSLIAVVVVVVLVVGRGRSHITPLCRVVAPLGHYQLTLDQAANAATIAAVGKTAGLPDHAVSVALAAALQESDLHNLPGGDRDSVGLFQQRPSQGWGPRDQLLKPSYAAGAFYDALQKVPGWETLPVTQAAQMVQRSAAPEAYAPWEQQARAMAEALTGEVPVGLSCQFDASRASSASVPLAAAMQNELGSATFTSADGVHQRLVAQWLVAHASSYRITSVTFGTWQWQSGHAAWSSLKHVQSQLAVTVAGQPGQAMTAAAVG